MLRRRGTLAKATALGVLVMGCGSDESPTQDSSDVFAAMDKACMERTNAISEAIAKASEARELLGDPERDPQRVRIEIADADEKLSSELILLRGDLLLIEAPEGAQDDLDTYAKTIESVSSDLGEAADYLRIGNGYRDYLLGRLNEKIAESTEQSLQLADELGLESCGSWWEGVEAGPGAPV